MTRASSACCRGLRLRRGLMLRWLFGETSLPGLSAKLASHRSVHPCSQPLLPEGTLSAPAARILAIMKPGLASPLALGQAVASAWLARRSFPREAFAEAAEACMLGMLRPRSKRGFTTRRLDVIAATMVIIRTMVDLQFELSLRKRQPARWAARMARLLLPSDLQLLIEDSPIMVMRLRYLLAGVSPEGDGIVYALCASAACYASGRLFVIGLEGIQVLQRVSRSMSELSCTLHIQMAGVPGTSCCAPKIGRAHV